MNKDSFVHAFTKTIIYKQWSKCSKLSAKIKENFATFFSKQEVIKSAL